MIRAIIFDCFGVLTTDLWQEFVTGLSLNQQHDVSALNRAYDAGHLDRDDFMRAVVDLTGKQPHYVEDQQMGDSPKNTALFSDIKVLKQSYKIGLLSNIGTDWVREHFLTTEDRALFDSLVFSFEVGLAKPDERIFRLACDRLGEPPEACVLVDDIERNCRGAEDIGMRAIVYQNLTQMRAELHKLLKP
jgi:epoxide hydrolase-like predicted phosphatase